MKTLPLKRAAAWSLVALLGVGCGSVAVDKSSSNASASGSGSGTGSESATGAGGASSASASGSSGGDVGGGIGFGGFPATSSGVGAGGSPAMPGPFDCAGCICDGSTHYCKLLEGGGPTPPPGPPPEPLCSQFPEQLRCLPLPAACFPTATCQCINPGQGGCTCKVDPAGITVTCVLP